MLLNQKPKLKKMQTTMKPKIKIDLWAILLIGVCLAILLFGCSTPQQLMDKAERKNPSIVAQYARDKYPCNDLLRPDTAVIWKDSLIYIDCPEPEPPAGNDYQKPGDTVTVVKWMPGTTRTVRVPVSIPVKSQLVTRWYEDSAKIKISQVAINQCKKEAEQLQNDNTRLQGKVANKTTENWIWRLIATVCICWIVFKNYKRWL